MEEIGCTNDDEMRNVRLKPPNNDDKMALLARLEQRYGNSEEGENDESCCAICLRGDGDMVKMTCEECSLQLYCVDCAETLRRVHNHRVCIACDRKIETVDTIDENCKDMFCRIWKDIKPCAIKIGLWGILVIVAVFIAFFFVACLITFSIVTNATWPAIVFYFDVEYSIDVLLHRDYFLEIKNVTFTDEYGGIVTKEEGVHVRIVETTIRSWHFIFLILAYAFYTVKIRNNANPTNAESFSQRIICFKGHWRLFFPLYIYLPLYLLSSFIIYGFFYFIFEPYIYHAFIPKSWDWISYEYFYFIGIDLCLFIHTAYWYSNDFQYFYNWTKALCRNEYDCIKQYISRKKESFIIYNTRLS